MPETNQRNNVKEEQLADYTHANSLSKRAQPTTSSERTKSAKRYSLLNPPSVEEDIILMNFSSGLQSDVYVPFKYMRGHTLRRRSRVVLETSVSASLTVLDNRHKKVCHKALNMVVQKQPLHLQLSDSAVCR